MELHIHIHHHDERLFTEIKSINSKLEIMSEKFDQMNSLLSSINDDTNNIAADLQRIAGQISGGLSADEATTVVASLQAAADKLKAVADINPEPATTTSQDSGAGTTEPTA